MVPELRLLEAKFTWVASVLPAAAKLSDPDEVAIAPEVPDIFVQFPTPVSGVDPVKEPVVEKSSVMAVNCA